MPEITLSPGTIEIIGFLLTLIVGLAVKDFAMTFVAGIFFKLNKDFNEGDIVYLDGGKAIIVSIGLRWTKFEISDERGTVWRFIRNDRVRFSKLEKIIDSNLNREH